MSENDFCVKHVFGKQDAEKCLATLFSNAFREVENQGKRVQLMVAPREMENIVKMICSSEYNESGDDQNKLWDAKVVFESGVHDFVLSSQ